MRTHYQNLRVSENAELEVIKAAYKALAQKWHPDRHPQNKDKAERYFKIITAAFEVLSDSEKRKEYDAFLLNERLHSATSNENTPTQATNTYRPKQTKTEPLLLSGGALKFAALKYALYSLVAAAALTMLIVKLAFLGHEWAITAFVMFVFALLGNTLMVMAGSYGKEMKPYKLIMLAGMPWLVVLGATALLPLAYFILFMLEIQRTEPNLFYISIGCLFVLYIILEKSIKSFRSSK